MPIKVKYISLDEALEIVRTPEFEISADGFTSEEAAATAAQAIVDAVAENIEIRLRTLVPLEIERAEA